MMKIGIIGMGHWGPNYVRNFNIIKDVTVEWCCDLQEENLQKLADHPDIRTTCDYHDILKDPSTQAVVVATTASSHYDIIKNCLEADKDVLAEKPLTLQANESLTLCQLAESRHRILMVGHTFLYNAGIRKMKEYIEQDEVGKIYYLNATRTHLGLVRSDVNAIWDLAPHDISIFNYLLDAKPVKISAVGASHLKEGREDVGFINLVYPGQVVANIHVSWADSNKERTIRIVGSKARVVFDDIDNLERVKLYKKGIHTAAECNSFGEFQLMLRDGDIISPMLESYEPLRKMSAHFVECVSKRTKPLTDGFQGYEVVGIMNEIEKSIKGNHQDG